MKKIILLLALLTILIGSIFFAYSIPNVRGKVAAALPLELKANIKNSIFVVSALKEELVFKDQRISILEKEANDQRSKAEHLDRQRIFADLSAGVTSTWPELARVYSQSQNNLLLERSPSRTITASDGKQYVLNQYNLPFLPTALNFGYKPLFYTDSTPKALYLVTGDGVVFKTDKQALGDDRLLLVTLPSNIRKVITDKAFFEPSWFSVKDLKILNNHAYISYNKKVADDRYTLGILKADLSQTPLLFEEFFSLDDSVSVREPFNAHQIGGRMVKFKGNQLLVSTGDHRKYEKAQDDHSLLGKIFAIDIETKKTQIISKGHRNVQGLNYDPSTEVVMSTEHGPVGGDEINLHLLGTSRNDVRNYGWPMVSYGKHYDSRFHEDAPLHKPHREHGFSEPLKQFTPSVGISQVIKVPNGFSTGFSNDYFAATMGLNPMVAIMSLHHFRLGKESSQITYESLIKIGERIRDMHVLNEKQIVLALEGNHIPAIALLQVK